MPTDREFEDFVRKRFEDYEKEAPAHTWSHIKSALQIERRSVVKKRLWMLAASLLVISFLSWLSYKQISEQNQEVVAAGSSVKLNPIQPDNSDAPSASKSHSPAITNKLPSKPQPTAENPMAETVLPDNQQPDRKPVLDALALEKARDNRIVPPPADLTIGSPHAEKKQVSRTHKAKKPITAKPLEMLPEKPEQGNNQSPAPKLSTTVKPANNKNLPERDNTSAWRDISEKTPPVTGIPRKSINQEPDVLLGNTPGAEPAEKFRQKIITSLPAKQLISGGQPSLEQMKRKLDSVSLQKTILLIPFAAAKDSSRLYRRSLPYSFGVYVSPRYSFIRSIPNVADSILIDQIHTENRFSRERLGYEVGFTINRTIHQKWNLTGSIFFNLQKETLSFSQHSSKPDSIAWTTAEDGVMHLTPHFNLHHRQYKNIYQTVGLTLGTSYYYSKTNRRSLYLMANAGLNRVVHSTIRQYESGITVETTSAQTLKQMNYRLSFGLGYAQRISRNFEVSIEPTVTYFLRSSFTSQAPVGVKSYTLGFNLGIRCGNW